MTTIVGISGSLRQNSYNTALLRAAAAAMPEGATLRIEAIRAIPLYDGDLERDAGIPPAVQALKDAIAAADGLLIATPEYNNSVPGVLKNAIDWLSRPPADIRRVFGDKAVAVIGATPGGFGTVLAQSAWLPVLRVLGTRPWFGARLAVARAANVFDANGVLTDQAVAQQLRAFVEGFVAFVRAGRN
jgi:NAD(P)H-dependent FMN reductase